MHENFPLDYIYHFGKVDQGRQPFEGLVRDVKRRLLIINDKQLRRRKKHFTTTLNCTISVKEVPLRVHDKAGHRNMRIRTASSYHYHERIQTEETVWSIGSISGMLCIGGAFQRK